MVSSLVSFHMMMVLSKGRSDRKGSPVSSLTATCSPVDDRDAPGPRWVRNLTSEGQVGRGAAGPEHRPGQGQVTRCSRTKWAKQCLTSPEIRALSPDTQASSTLISASSDD